MAGSSAHEKRKRRNDCLDIMAGAIPGETLEQLARAVIDARKHRRAPLPQQRWAKFTQAPDHGG